MPRNMSFALTTDQVRNQEKFVTRRFGWWFLNPGEIVNTCEKCMGLKKGETITRINQIRIVSTRSEPLNRMIIDPDYGRRECWLEGFSGMNPFEFVEMITRHYSCDAAREVNRIRFEYINKEQ